VDSSEPGYRVAVDVGGEAAAQGGAGRGGPLRRRKVAKRFQNHAGSARETCVS